MNANLDKLHPYPFEKLAKLKQGIVPPDGLEHISLSIGEPKHTPPQFVLDTLVSHLDKITQYPATKGLPELRTAIADWTTRRFNLIPGTLNSEEHILPVNGTREALFAIAQAVVDTHQKPLVISPNPFYQIYEGAAFLAGADLRFLNCTKENNYTPDVSTLSEDDLRRCQLMYICTPGNPSGAVMDLNELKQLIALADEYDFVIASDECYSELYFDEDQPPPGLLQACAELGRNDFKNCLIFHSLSKRSNLPGLRSGFVAGDARLIKPFLKYRTYHGCAMSVNTQLASVTAWNDETHVRNNRDLYRAKFDAVLNILGNTLNVSKPEASFYLWPQLEENDEQFAKRLFAEQNITVLPGSYLARPNLGINPGEKHVRMALVATLDECVEAAERIKHFVSKG